MREPPVAMGPIGVFDTWRPHGEYTVGEHVSLRFSDKFYAAEVLAVTPDEHHRPARDRVTLAIIERLPA